MEEKLCYGCMQMKTQSPVCEHCGFNEHAVNMPHQLPFGTVLRGQYLIGKVLGQGGFGITYMGYDQSLNIPVAIKEYFPASFVSREIGESRMVIGKNSNSEAAFATSKKRFLREAQSLARLSNVPQIVKVLNFFEENNTGYIIMEYIRGIDLGKYINYRGGKLTVEETFYILRPVMSALAAVHETGLVHRDISPDNIMMLPNGGAKLLDFGSARQVDDADVDRELAKSTEAILKQGFAPVEQYQRRGSLGPWTDVYSLCATVYYCLTGRIPADATARLTDGAQVDWAAIPGLSQHQVEVLEKGMAIRPKDRFSTVSELEMALFGVIPQQPAFQQPLQQTAYLEPMQPAQPVQQPVQQPAQPEQQPSAYPSRTLALDVEEASAPGGSYPSYTLPLQEGGAAPAPQNHTPAAVPGQELPLQESTVPAQPEGMYTAPVQAFTQPVTTTAAKKPRGKKSVIGGVSLALVLAILVGGLYYYFCVHKWSEPTCTEGSKCYICGKVRDDAHGHKWSEPTCTEGSKCLVCGEQGAGPMGHYFSNATYDSPQVCHTCGETNGNPLGWIGDVSGHWGNRFYRSGRRTGSYELEKKLVNCYRFTLTYTITDIDYGSPYGNFEVFVRYGDKEWEWESIGMFSLEKGENSTTVDAELPRGYSFDAIAVVCQAYGSYSYSHSVKITDVQVYVD